MVVQATLNYPTREAAHCSTLSGISGSSNHVLARNPHAEKENHDFNEKHLVTQPPKSGPNNNHMTIMGPNAMRLPKLQSLYQTFTNMVVSLN